MKKVKVFSCHLGNWMPNFSKGGLKANILNQEYIRLKFYLSLLDLQFTIFVLP